jgi:hypothetical protein
MNQEKTEQSEKLKQIKANLRAKANYGLLVLIVCSIVFNVLYTDMRLAENRYELNLTESFNVNVNLLVNYPSDLSETYSLTNNFTFISHDAESRLISHIYFFEIMNLSLTANFDTIFLLFAIEEKAFVSFIFIESMYFIEDHKEIFQKDNFDKSTEGLAFYIAKIDITRFMWKEAVPSEISAKIRFYTL